jgi:hypothetical protein
VPVVEPAPVAPVVPAAPLGKLSLVTAEPADEDVPDVLTPRGMHISHAALYTRNMQYTSLLRSGDLEGLAELRSRPLAHE